MPCNFSIAPVALRLLLFALSVVCASLFVFPFSARAEIIPATRRVDWSSAGVSGGIPNRSTVCATLDAAVYGNGTTDATAAIQSALAACPAGQVVYLPAGTYRITSGITIPSGKTLRGAGMGQTIIKNSTEVAYLAGFNNSPDYYFTQSTARDITGGNTKGSSTITTSSAHGWSAGDLVLIDQLEDPAGDPPITSTGGEGPCTWCSRASGTRPAGQIAKVVSVPDATTAVLELPLNKNYDKSPQGIRLRGITANAGIEDLTLDSTSACAGANNGIFSNNFSENSWILRVEMKQVCRIGLLMATTYRNTVRGCKIHETTHHTSNGGYLMWMMTAGSANAVEDNIFYNGLVGIIYNGALSGNVFAYNYITKTWNSDYPGRGSGGIASHGAQPMMNLFEGNYLDGPVISNDFTWGSTAYSTYFRNKQRTDTAPDPPVNQLYGVALFDNAWYMNFVGNVFGTVGYETVYQSSEIYDGRKGIFFLNDSGVTNTVLRHGNWDSVQNGQRWDGTIADHSIPDSMYLSSRPSWWCAEASWPPVNPAGASVSAIPAKRRYDGAMCTAVSAESDVTAPAAPAGLAVN